jgi:glycosyltransferase involved in cell wall biosynthesis
MRVGLNLIYLVPGETGGMEVVARELIPALLTQAPGVSFTAFVNREAAAAADGPWGELLPAVTVPVNARSRPQWVLGEQTLLPVLARRERVDLLHSLANTAPAWGGFRRVLTVHDLIYARFPETHAGVRALALRLLVPLAVRRSQRVMADSVSTRRDLVELLGASEEKIDVVELGLGTPQRVTPLGESAVRARFELGDRAVILSLSAKRPHKNLGALIGALARVPANERPLLLIPGYPTDHELELRRQAETLGIADDVRLLSWLSAAELEGIWALARAFVFPSLYEGFGLPVLEAMARGVPVACSNASSLPEVAGEAALLFDPADEPAIAQAISRLLSDEELCAELRRRGAERARLFTWERTAQLALASYARALGLAGVPDSWTAPRPPRA